MKYIEYDKSEEDFGTRRTCSSKNNRYIHECGILNMIKVKRTSGIEELVLRRTTAPCRSCQDEGNSNIKNITTTLSLRFDCNLFANFVCKHHHYDCNHNQGNRFRIQ